MNIMHRKTVKFITQLRHATQRENDATQTSEVSKYQIISQPKLDKFQVAMLGLQQMFEVTAARFHAVTQTFAPLIDSVVDDTLLQTGPLGDQTSLRSCPSRVIPRSHKPAGGRRSVGIGGFSENPHIGGNRSKDP